MEFGKKGIFLAPMAGITETVFRSLCKKTGADVVMSEMVSAEGVFHGAKNTRALLVFEPAERPIGIQIFGAHPGHIAYAAAYIEEHARPDFIDLNSGCPVPKVVKKNGGSALLRDPRLFRDIVSAMVKAVSTPVTVKLRSGWLQNEYVDVEFARIAQESGASAVIIHPRSKSMAFSGHSLWERIAAVKDAVSIPVIGNGDICLPGDAKAMFDQTKCDSIMVGRAAMGDPWIFSRIKSALCGQSAPETPIKERFLMVMEHLRRYIEVNGEKAAIAEMKKHVAWYIKGLPGATSLRNGIFRAATIRELEEKIQMAFGNSIL
jgi:tRNA-dihydrouridine synthase B